jgi:hypothetical protein
MDPQCTETIVLKIVTEVNAATAACSGLQGILSSSLANQIVDVVDVSPNYYRPNLMRSALNVL